MLLQLSVAVCLVLSLLAVQDVKTQDVAHQMIDGHQSSGGEENRTQLLIQLPPSGKDIIEWLTNMTNEWAGGDSSGENVMIIENDSRLEPLMADNQTMTPLPVSSSRRARKLFKNMLQMKPKVSPLYLVNGTVCRFVNTQPICTTLSTSGLFRGQNPINTNQLNNGLLQQQQQQLNNGGLNNGGLINGGLNNGLLSQQTQQQPGQFNQNLQPNQRQG